MERIAAFQLFDARTRATSKAEYLRRPDLGRTLSDESRELVRTRCPAGCELQVVIGDGLSATAVAVQAPGLLDRLRDAALARGWSFGRPFLVRYCRVGVMNDIGDLLSPAVIVLLIGERPGLATAESLSAYMAYRPRIGHTDADRNLDLEHPRPRCEPRRGDPPHRRTRRPVSGRWPQWRRTEGSVGLRPLRTQLLCLSPTRPQHPAYYCVRMAQAPFRVLHAHLRNACNNCFTLSSP